jgi:hypothetical protein
MFIMQSIGIKYFRLSDHSRLFLMAATVQQLIWILQLFFPPELAAQQAIYVLGVVISLYPIVRLHLNQMNEARRQSPLTAWMRSIQTLLTRAFHEEANNVQAWATGINLAEEYSAYLCRDLHRLYTLLGLTDEMADPASFLFRPARRILCTPRLNCKFCPAADRNLVPSLRRRSKGKDRRVWLLDSTFRWVSADLLVGRCGTCKADYYPDMITRKAAGRGQKRSQVLEYEPEFLRVSKLGVWVHRASSPISLFAFLASGMVLEQACIPQTCLQARLSFSSLSFYFKLPW